MIGVKQQSCPKLRLRKQGEKGLGLKQQVFLSR